VKAFDAAYRTKFPKAAAKITDDVDELLAFYDYPAEHWTSAAICRPFPRLPHATTRLTRAAMACDWPRTKAV
jgi:transposase-like protein